MKPVVFADEVGWRHALLDAAWMAWVCPHVHATAHEAKSCREKDGRAPTKVPEGLTLEEVQDFPPSPTRATWRRARSRSGWLVPQRPRRHAAGVVDELVAAAKGDGLGNGHHARRDAHDVRGVSGTVADRKAGCRRAA